MNLFHGAALCVRATFFLHPCPNELGRSFHQKKYLSGWLRRRGNRLEHFCIHSGKSARIHLSEGRATATVWGTEAVGQTMRRVGILALSLLWMAMVSAPKCAAQGALLMEEPYGFFGSLNPTGHNAIYLSRVCAETPTQLRRCHAGEMGAVIARYQGMNGYDWVAMPLLPYLYSVENIQDVPRRVDPALVRRLRGQYHERRLMALGPHLSEGGFFHGGWKELVGVSYERRIWAFRFNTTAEQDDQLIALLNSGPNRSRFSLLFNNCADFARELLDFYYPKTFDRSIFPDAGMTTPKQIAYKLTKYARKHPETGLEVFLLPQIPGLHRHSHSNKDIAESLATSAYALPLAAVSPYLLGGIAVDYLVRAHRGVIPRHPEKLDAEHLATLTESGMRTESIARAGSEASGALLAPHTTTVEEAELPTVVREGMLKHE